MRNQNRKLFKRVDNKAQKLSLDLLGSGLFYGIKFFSSWNELIDGLERTTAKPNVTIDGDNIFFDYSSVNNEDQRRILDLKFKYANSGDSFTVEDGSYADPSRSIDNVNITGTYLFQEFLSNSIIKAKINSASIGTTKKLYSKYFTLVPQITFQSGIKGSSKVYGCKNMLGNTSKNSIFGLGVNEHDYLRFTTKENTKTFRVEDGFTINGIEYFIFDIACITENNFDESIYIEHLREKQSIPNTISRDSTGEVRNSALPEATPEQIQQSFPQNIISPRIPEQ